MAVDSRSPRPPDQLRARTAPSRRPPVAFRSGWTRGGNVEPGAHDWVYAMNALRYSFAFLADNWRQAAADSVTSGSAVP